MELPAELEDLVSGLDGLIDWKEITLRSMQSGYEEHTRILGGYNFLLIHLLGAIDKGMGSSLTQLCGQADRLGISTSPSSLQSRYSEKASLFMKLVSQHLMSRVLGSNSILQGVQSAFDGVYVTDSTLVELPARLADLYKGVGGSASPASLKIDATFDLQSDWSSFSLRNGSTTDYNSIMGPPRKSLWLRDLGYYKTDEWVHLDQQGAYFVSRAHATANLYLDREGKNTFDPLTLLSQLKENQYAQRTVYIGQKQRLKVRLVLQRLPDEVAKKKRQKLKKRRSSKGKSVSDRQLALCALNSFITNLPADEWKAEQVIELYRIRWQIELIFKVWKSLLHLEDVQPMNRHRFECSLYAMLIYITLQYRLQHQVKAYYWNEQGIELSTDKLTKLILVQIEYVKQLLVGVTQAARKLVYFLFRQSPRLAVKQHRKGRRNPLFYLIC